MAAYSGSTTVHSFNISYAGCTDAGKVKPINEDNLLIMPMQGIFAVADGVGGLDAGEVASRIVLETVHDLMCIPTIEKTRQPSQSFFSKITSFANHFFKKKNYAGAFSMEEILDIANFQVFRHAVKKKMATTIVIAYFEGRVLKIANIGDSRGYLWRDENLIQVTNDHSFVGNLYRQGKITCEEMRTHKKRNIITNAIGNKSWIKAEFYQLDGREEDVILLCTDGLTAMLSDDSINKILYLYKDNITRLSEALIEKANNEGGKDNITIIIFKINKTCHL